MSKDLENLLNDKITDYSLINKYAGKKDITAGKSPDNLAAISVGLSSREQVRALSYGEVLISETINYRTQRPERGGLFCEQIFGPRKNYECACGKYKRIRYKGIVCEKCGVEVTTSQVRRQRTGHVELAAPVAHIWYLKSVPSRIGLLLDISVKKLEQVVYFASYVITDVYEGNPLTLDEQTELDTLIKDIEKTENERKKREAAIYASIDTSEIDKIKNRLSKKYSNLSKIHNDFASTNLEISKEIYELYLTQALTSEKENKEGNLSFTLTTNGFDFVFFHNQAWHKQNKKSPEYYLYEPENKDIKELENKLKDMKKQFLEKDGIYLDLVRKIKEKESRQSELEGKKGRDLRGESLKELENAYKNQKIHLQREIQDTVNNLEDGKISKKEFAELERMHTAKLDELEAEYVKLKDLLKSLKVGEVIGELDYRVVYEKFPHVFKGGTGAEHLKTLLERIDLKAFITEQQAELKSAPKSRQKKILQKLKLASSLYKSGQRPEHFILTALQILPPDLRPMIQLDGGRFASSDLNDLYRRVINRNNRLRKLSELGAPEVILKNEKRMLQESVDMLISGDVRSNRPGYTTATKKKLKSLSDVLKGKQGRFRQNLLGKRVDYSGRSVIIVGPELEMNECGLPKMMALILFKPFVIGRLIQQELAYNVKHAEKIIEEKGKEVWDALDEVIQGKYVLLNRAPTLHRLGIQAFRPVLIDGKAIRLHPLCCTAFNADFDGDQMAVHLPLTLEAQREASGLMVTSKNMLNPSNGEPIVAPSQDIILGCYYLTKILPGDSIAAFASGDDAMVAYENKVIELHSPIKLRVDGQILDTTYGRYLFNEILPKELGYVNETVGKGPMKKLLSRAFELLGGEQTAFLADRVKSIGYKYATISGLTVSIFDMIIPDEKHDFVKEGEEKIKAIQKAYWHGLVNENERYLQSIRVWSETKSRIEKEMKKNFDQKNPLYNLVDSGARGNWGNVTQLCGMKGLVVSPTGKTIELPIKSNLKEGFSTLEYFIATHGGRKGKADTALKTAQSGYLTRRLVDAAQNILVRECDCHTVHFEEYSRENKTSQFGDSFEAKIYGKYTARDVIDTAGVVILPQGTLITKSELKAVLDSSAESVAVRTVLTCETEEGVCQKCYGLDMATNDIVKMGTPVGIIAAQSIGEPGTQLTMRTFHSGGVAKEGGDITAGLSRVEELFEARTPKYLAEIAPFPAEITSIEREGGHMTVTLTATDIQRREYYLGETMTWTVAKSDIVDEKQIIAKSKETRQRLQSLKKGRVISIKDECAIVEDLTPAVVTFTVPAGRNLLVNKGDRVSTGAKITEGHIALQSLMEVAGSLPTEMYIVQDIKEIYASQGQTVNAKHIELIVRQMFSKVKITNAGDSTFFPGDIVDIIRYHKENRELMKNGLREAIGTPLLLGLTKISLFTDSWLSSASFQETVRVLVEASTARQIDYLEGLKENVIIGRLIPTLKYFENNQDVGEYFAHENDHTGIYHEDEEELEITSAGTSMI